MIDYKSKKVREIILRQGGVLLNLSRYGRKVNFGKFEFDLFMLPELINQIKFINQLYNDNKDRFLNKSESELEEIYYTSNIEGANLSTIYETREILEGKSVSKKKDGMVLGHSRAIEVLGQMQDCELNVSMANEVQEAVVSYYNENGKSGYRDNGIFIGSETEEIFRPCDCSLIPELYPEVFKEYTPFTIVNAALLHFLLVYLHPYYDGNGRTARLLMKEYLVRNGYEALVRIPISKYIYDSISGYYKSINLSEKDMDVTHFVIYVLDVLERCIVDNIE